MPLEIATRSEVNQTGQGHIRAELPELSAVGQRRSFVAGLTRSFFGAVHDLYRAMKRYADNEPFPQSASESFFRTGWWIDITGLSRNQPAAAKGSIVFTGTSGTVVGSGQALTVNGNTYTVDEAVTVISQTLTGVSSYSDDFTGVFTTPSEHNLASGMTLTITGGIDSSLNGTFEIRVLDSTTFEYDLTTRITGTPLEPSPVAAGSWANALITASITGTDGNIDAGSTLDVTSPPVGLDTTALVTFGGIADGSDLEALEDWRERVLEGLGTDFGMFTADEIKIVAKTVPGVTRVFVRKPKRVETEGYPLEGQVRIAFLREDDADPIPSSLEVEQVRSKIYSELLPAHTLEEDVEVLAPERFNLNIEFRSITPDTPGMRTSIRNQILEWIADDATWGGTLEVEALRCAIRHAYDAETGATLTSYDLASPTTDITLTADGFPVLNTINWTAS